ncbi:MAG TPA: trehalase-like domain-containing protein, partial [Nitrospiraceae bacterium]|nr:trehalase-like domain-containing protein [Nitrospiraceae bacterium]
MAYQPIQNYGLIGNMRTAALVGVNGSIDWLCFPHFDSPSIFAAILDDQKGGKFQISPVSERVTCKQLYWPDTNVLITRFLSPDGVGEIEDFMPVGHPFESEWHHQLVRRVKLMRGSITFRVQCYPAFDYARATHQTTLTKQGVRFDAQDLTLGLATTIPL